MSTYNASKKESNITMSKIRLLICLMVGTMFVYTKPADVKKFDFKKGIPVMTILLATYALSLILEQCGLKIAAAECEPAVGVE